MIIRNFSAEYENILYSWLPHDLKADEVIFLPDACPGNSPLPTGTVVKTTQHDWRKFAISDCGCGMLLAKTQLTVNQFNKKYWDSLYFDLKKNKGQTGDLGSGNHFLDALQSYYDDFLYFLIHTGSRDESKSVERLVDTPKTFDKVFKDVCNWALSNRMEISNMLSKYFGKIEIVLDVNHNDFELFNDGSVIIRKGAVKVNKGEKTIIPSNMDGDVVMVEATEQIDQTLYSMSHGTGRIMSRSEAKNFADQYNYQSLRQRIYIPDSISNDSIKTEAPFCYRDINKCMELVNGLIVEVKRFVPIAYLGQI